MQQSPPFIQQNHISRIKVTKLFGHLNYDLYLSATDTEYDDLLILYGDNGSGKTTLLTMIFNILSTQTGRGYKTYLSRTPFATFEIHFSSGSRIIVKKPPSNF